MNQLSKNLDFILNKFYDINTDVRTEISALRLLIFKENDLVQYTDEAIFTLLDLLVDEGYLKVENRNFINFYSITIKGIRKISKGGFNKEETDIQFKDFLYEYGQYGIIIAGVYYVVGIIDFLVKYKDFLCRLFN